MATTNKKASTKSVKETATETNPAANAVLAGTKPDDAKSTNPATNGTDTEKAKAPRLTLIAALLAGDAKGVARVLINQGRTEEEISKFSLTFNEAVVSFKVLEKEIKEQEEAKRLEDEKERAEKEQIRLESLEIAEAAKQEAIKAMVDGLKKKGISEETAMKVALQTFGGNIGNRNTSPKVRVKCVFEGTEYLVAKTGNNKEATKEAIAKSGLTREEFITKYQVQEENADAAA